MAVLFVMYPYLGTLRLIGPRLALRVARSVAWLHWLGTFSGTERSIRNSVELVKSNFDTPISVSQFSRRYLTQVHQHFAEWYLYPTRRGRRYVESRIEEIEGREHLDAALAAKRGAVVLIYHFGAYRLIAAGLKAHGYSCAQHIYRAATYQGATFSWVARLASRRQAENEDAAGLEIAFHRPNLTFPLLVRMLGRGQTIVMTGDGMMTTDVADVDFLGHSLRVPTGFAKLAAHAGAPIVPVFSIVEGLDRHRLVAHPPLYCDLKQPDTIDSAIRSTVDLLERYVCRYPWLWSTWRRIEVSKLPSGQAAFRFRALAVDSTTRDHQSRFTRATDTMSAAAD